MIARDGGAGLGDGERDTLTGEGVDVAAGVADEQHPAGDPGLGPLAQRTGAHDLADGLRRPGSGRRSAGKAARRSSNEPRVEVSIAMPTRSGATGVTYASASAAQCTSTYDVHGATR